MLKFISGFQPVAAIFCCMAWAVLCLILSINLSVAYAQAEDSELEDKKIVISANRYESMSSKVGSSVSVITSEDIERMQSRYVHEVLRSVPYLDVIRNGGQGGNVSIFIRGANSEHTLVLVDGVEINNPATTNRSVNLSSLTVDNIERIEILRGAQSTLYGSDALGGVIAIYSKKGKTVPETNVNVEGGAFNTVRSSVATAGVKDRVNYSLAAGYDESDGISAAAKESGNSERDGYQNSSASGRVAFDFNKDNSLSVLARYTRNKADIDNQGGVGGDDLNRNILDEQFLARSELVTKVLSPKLTHTLGVSYLNQELKDNNDPDILSNEFLRSVFDGSQIKFDFLNRWQATEQFVAMLGLEIKEEKASSSFLSDGVFGPFEDNFAGQEMRTNSAFINTNWSIDKSLTLNMGGRYDDNSVSGAETTYRAGPVLCLYDCATRLMANIGTGYKAPSLFQLYSAYGNKSLQAEESFNWDIGVEQKLIDDKLSLGATWFRNTIDNLVTFDNQTFLFENIDEARIYGLELFALIELTDSWSWRNDFTYIDARNSETGDFLLRRARNKYSSEIIKSFMEKQFDVALKVSAYDGRYDNDFSSFPAQRTKMSGYAVVDLSTNYSLNDTVGIYGRIENLLDKEYQEVLGFGTPGIAAYAGVKVAL